MNLFRIAVALVASLLAGSGGGAWAAEGTGPATAPSPALLSQNEREVREGFVSSLERERNDWPILVRRLNVAGQTREWTAAGPLIFRKPIAENGTAAGFRPFWVETHNAAGQFRA